MPRHASAVALAVAADLGYPRLPETLHSTLEPTNGPRAKGCGASCTAVVWVIRAERHEYRYSALLDGERIGHVACVQVGDVIVVPHLYVDAAFRSMGLDLDLVRALCGDAQDEGLTVLTGSTFMQRFAYLHPRFDAILRMPHPGETATIAAVVQAAEDYEESRLAAESVSRG